MWKSFQRTRNLWKLAILHFCSSTWVNFSLASSIRGGTAAKALAFDDPSLDWVLFRCRWLWNTKLRMSCFNVLKDCMREFLQLQLVWDFGIRCAQGRCWFSWYLGDKSGAVSNFVKKSLTVFLIRSRRWSLTCFGCLVSNLLFPFQLDTESEIRFLSRTTSKFFRVHLVSTR